MRLNPERQVDLAFSAVFIQELLDTYDAAKADALFRLMAERHVWAVPTLVMWRAFAEGRFVTEGRFVDADVATEVRRLYLKQLEIVRMMHAAGIEILAGTDNHGTLSDELSLLVQAGLSPAEALRAATLETARFLRRDGTAGAIDPGKVADLVLLDGDPLEDIAATERVWAVVMKGHLLDHGTVERLRANRASLRLFGR